VVAHFFGWFFKALLVRDYVLCWVMSLSWEFIEKFLTHMLPNFAECWWDSWILDVILTNGVGIYLGIKTCQYLEIKQYKWSSIRDLDTFTKRMNRALMQFTPEKWTRVSWQPQSSINRFLALHILFWAVQCQELNAFMLKQLLWVTEQSNLNVYRLIIWYFLGLPALRQTFYFITRDNVPRLGMHAWLAVSCMATEFILICKLGRPFHEEFPKPMPLGRKIGFVIMLTGYILWTLRVCLRIRHPSSKVLPKEGKGKMA